MRKALLRAVVAWLMFGAGSWGVAQESCEDFLFGLCMGDPTQYDCVQVTTALTRLRGGESTKVLQEYCFQIDSPLIQEVLIDADQGSIQLDTLAEGDSVGEVRFDALLSTFGAECPAGDEAQLDAPIRVSTEGDEQVGLVVAIEDVSVPMTECLLNYDPTDAAHNSGRMLEGTLTAVKGGGFQMSLHLADLDEGAQNPGLEMGDLQDSASPAPLFFDPITRGDLFFLPSGGGELIVTTTLTAENSLLQSVSAEFEDLFEIEAGAAKRFVRGDANADDKVDLSDAVSILNYLFLGGAAPPCAKAADVDANGSLELTDAVRDLNFLFTGGPSPEAPYPGCGVEPPPASSLTCDSYPPCEGG